MVRCILENNPELRLIRILCIKFNYLSIIKLLGINLEKLLYLTKQHAVRQLLHLLLANSPRLIQLAFKKY